MFGWSNNSCYAIDKFYKMFVETFDDSIHYPLLSCRRVFEALAGGILLPDSPGFLDPCEKEPMDSATNLTNQVTFISWHISGRI